MSELREKPDLPIDIYQILKFIPHRYPFLLIDRILDIEIGKKVVVLKNVTMNEPFFNGHFPEFPVMPGVLIIEAMAQSAGVLSVLSFGDRKENELYFFAAIDEAKFKRPVVPGDSLRFEVQLIKLIRGIGIYEAKAFVENEVVAEAKIKVAKKEI